MRLRDFFESIDGLGFPASGAQGRPDKEAVMATRNRAAEAVADDEFLSDCISQELVRLQNSRILWGLDPFVIIPETGIRMALGFWPPGATAGAHEHTAWTITSVCRNRLEVATYDRETAYRENELVVKNRFDATAGRTGFIYDPCIHEPRNPTGDWSLTLHITSPRDGERSPDCEKPPTCLRSGPGLPNFAMDHPYVSVHRRRRQQSFVHQLARILCAMEVPSAKLNLGKILESCSSATRQLICDRRPEVACQRAIDGNWTLERANRNLVLTQYVDAGNVSLAAETPYGFQEELVMSDVASQALAFLVERDVFDLGELPGNLTQDERQKIGLILEQTGLFKRVWRQ